jgi:phosphoribosyl-ATP pyrophosphohydrolase/phosphoribosyl-AMP cyclohydrolase/histidinol dehydrogenase
LNWQTVKTLSFSNFLMIIKITKNELHLLQPIALVAQVLISEEMYQPEYLAWVESSSMDLVKLADLGAERIIVKSKVTNLPEERVGLLSKDGIVTSGVKFRFVDTLDIDGSDNVIVPASLFAAANDPLLCFCQFYFRNLKSDRPDGLFPTIVVNEQQVALGLCYSSLESILESLRTRSGVYFSRKRGLWHKGKTSGAIQTLIRISVDCDSDTLRFIVCQQGAGFCHLDTSTCFGSLLGINALFQTLSQRFVNAPAGSYTKRLFDDSDMLDSKIREEADELCTAHTSNEVAWEAADLIYFAAAKCVSKGVTWTDIEANLNLKSKKLTRRPGDVKPKYTAQTEPNVKRIKVEDDAGDFTLNVFNADELSEKDYNALLKRPIINTAKIMEVVHPIVNNVKANGDAAVKDYTKKFDQVDLTDIVIDAPFNSQLMELDETVKNAIDVAYSNIWKFHEAQLENSPLIVETMPGITCTRFFRPIEKVGLYVPGGTAILPSSTLMLGIPAKVAGCKEIIIATPPRKDGRVSPEVVYVAHLVGASKILLAGGAQAVAAMAYGTESIPKVDKICGPGNQYVTAAKMICQVIDFNQV